MPRRRPEPAMVPMPCVHWTWPRSRTTRGWPAGSPRWPSAEEAAAALEELVRDVESAFSPGLVGATATLSDESDPETTAGGETVGPAGAGARRLLRSPPAVRYSPDPGVVQLSYR